MERRELTIFSSTGNLNLIGSLQERNIQRGAEEETIRVTVGTRNNQVNSPTRNISLINTGYITIIKEDYKMVTFTKHWRVILSVTKSKKISQYFKATKTVELPAI